MKCGKLRNKNDIATIIVILGFEIVKYS